MPSWFERWFGYGLGMGIGRALLGEGGDDGAKGPIRSMTEADILADEKRFDDDERRYDEEALSLDARETRARDKNKMERPTSS